MIHCSGGLEDLEVVWGCCLLIPQGGMFPLVPYSSWISGFQYMCFFPILRTGWWSYKQIMSGVGFLNRSFSWFKGKICLFMNISHRFFLKPLIVSARHGPFHSGPTGWGTCSRFLEATCAICRMVTLVGLYVYIIILYIYILYTFLWILGKLMTIHFYREFSIVIILYTYTIMDSSYGMDDHTHKT